MVQRYQITEDEHELLAEVGDEFWIKLGELAAQCIARMPPELESLTTTYLQDRCSIYGTKYSDELAKLRD